MSAIVVITTVGTQEQANLIAEELVGRRQAACVNILTVSRSVYRWQGRVCDDSEYLLVIKTLESEYPQVEATIQELHQYELPGQPASHGCVRLLERDAKWVYDWGRSWILDERGWNVVENGAPVVILGEYPHGETPPWREASLLRSGFELSRAGLWLTQAAMELAGAEWSRISSDPPDFVSE